MNKGLLGVITFTIGAAVGSVVTYKLTAEKIRAEEKESRQHVIDEIRQLYLGKAESKSEKIPEEKNDENDPYVVRVFQDSIDEVKGIIRKQDYTAFSKPKEEHVAKEVEEKPQGPYILNDSEELGDCGYDIIELLYFADGYLTDEYLELIDDIEDKVGYDALNYFGDRDEESEDSVAVRNDIRKVDYRIDLDLRYYEDLKSNEPKAYTIE